MNTNTTMNSYAISMRRNRARACIRSLRHYRKTRELGPLDMAMVTATVRGAIDDYRATIHAIRLAELVAYRNGR